MSLGYSMYTIEIMPVYLYIQTHVHIHRTYNNTHFVKQTICVFTYTFTRQFYYIYMYNNSCLFIIVIKIANHGILFSPKGIVTMIQLSNNNYSFSSIYIYVNNEYTEATKRQENKKNIKMISDNNYHNKTNII